MNRLSELRRRRKEIFSIGKRYGAKRIRVFGSVARADERPDSDIDFLVEFEDGRSLLDEAGLLLDLQDLLNARVDVVGENAVSHYIREQALKEAIDL